MTDKKITEGEYRVGISFNPGNHSVVDEIKQRSAELIDLVLSNGKDGRTAALAATGFEEAAMWAVKSVTKPPKQ